MTTHRERLLGQARADLTALPDLYAELARTLTERHHDVSGYAGKIAGSPAPLSIPVVHLADDRHKPGWWGEDPRAQDLGDRYGITPMLETWVRVLSDELPGTTEPTKRADWIRERWTGQLPAVLELTEHATVRSECSVLVEFWPFIEAQQWATELAEDVTRITASVRAQLGVRPEYRPRCRKCKNTVIPVDADRKLTSWEAAAYGACTGCDWTYPKGPALDALAQVQEPMPLAQVSDITGVPLVSLRRYEDQGLIVAKGCKGNARTFDLAAVTDALAIIREKAPPSRNENGRFQADVAQDA